MRLALRSRLRTLVGCSLVVSCAPATPAPLPAPSQPVATSSFLPETTPTPPPSAADRKEEALQERLQTALAYVSQVRSLAAKSEVKGRLISRDEINKYVSSQLDDETPPDVLEAMTAMLYGFGTVDADFDYRKSIIGLMTSQLLGFYDPKQKTFFVGGDLSGDEADVTLWHELVHALQDQHYDLSHLTEFEQDGGDRQSAVHGLAEGDATSAMLDAMLKPRGGSALEVPESLLQAQTLLGTAVASAPPVLVRSLLAPYMDGLAFTNALRRRGGFAAVDEAWRSPPTSTEQLLHLDKYLSHEAPLVVPVPIPPAQLGLAERFHDVMGEQTIRLLLEEWLPARTAAGAASDWGGDRLAAFADDARQRWAIGWHLRFDSASAAERAFRAFARVAPQTELGTPRAIVANSDKPTPAADKVCRRRHSQGPLALVRRGPDVAVTVGPFQRNSVAVSPDPDCASALKWANEILRQ